MGYAASILAVRCPDRAGVLNALKSTETQEPIAWSKATSKFGSRAGVASLGSDWTIIVGHVDGFDDASLREASELGLVVTCSVYENLGFSAAQAFEHGDKLWSIEHNACDHGEDHLRIEGQLTPEVRDIYQRFWAKHRANEPTLVTLADGRETSADTDWLMELAPEAAAAVCGLRPDYGLDNAAPNIPLVRIRRWPLYRRVASSSKRRQTERIRSRDARGVERTALRSPRSPRRENRREAASFTSIAVNAGDKNALLAALRLEDTGQPISPEDATHPRRRCGGVALLPSGWVYVTGRLAQLEERPLKAVSRLALLITCSFDGRAKRSEVRAYLRGRRIWSARHDLNKHKYHLRARGELPRQFGEIRHRLRRAEIDPESREGIIDIPLELAGSIYGVRPDFYLQSDTPEVSFTALRQVRPPKPTTPFWPRFKAALKRGWSAANASRKDRLRRRKGRRPIS